MTETGTEIELDYQSRHEARQARMRQARRKSKTSGLRLLYRACQFLGAQTSGDAKAARVSMEVWACRLADALGEMNDLSGETEPCEWGKGDAER